MGQLLDQVHNELRRPGTECLTAHAIANPEHGPDIAAALEMWPTVTYAAISRAATKFGIEVPVGSLARHRRGECACP